MCVCKCALLSLQFKLGNLDAKRDWGHAKDYVEVSTYCCIYTGVGPTESLQAIQCPIFDSTACGFGMVF